MTYEFRELTPEEIERHKANRRIVLASRRLGKVRSALEPPKKTEEKDDK
jgi:hypothetical protein